MNTLLAEIHQKALNTAAAYKRCEYELIEILEQVDRHKVYLQYGYNSLFKYATDALKLSEEVAYIFINVCRKTREVPALREEIRTGAISVSKAKKITSVINENNQSHWLELARTSTSKSLEKEVATANPMAAVREKLNYVNPNDEIKENVKFVNHAARVQLQVGVSEQFMIKLRRAQDLLSQKNQNNIGLEHVLSEALDLFINKNDPLVKAKRQLIKGNLNVSVNRQQVSRLVAVAPASKNNYRKPIPASTRHKLWLKHDGKCTYVDTKGNRCNQKRFLHIHHQTAVSNGGTNELENLTLLCSGHHKVEHLRP